MRFFFLILPIFLIANPKGEKVVSGKASFAREENSLKISHSENAIIHWDEFSILEKESTFFEGASVLNRVISNKPTEIYGKLAGKGNVFLINQNGILIGKEGQISLQSFYATTGNLSDAEFLEGAYLCKGLDKSIEVYGEIIAEKDLFLLAREVKNHGELTSENVYLYAADQAEIGPAAIRLKGDGYVENTGLIEAVHTEMRAASSLSMLAINHAGVIEGTSFEKRDGEVFLSSSNGFLQMTGEVSAKEVTFDGKYIDLEGAKVSAKEGNISIGNLETRSLHVDEDSQIIASGERGGEIFLYGHEANWFLGIAEAVPKGFIEISGKGILDIHGKVHTDGGTVLFDPNDVVITPGASTAYTIMGIVPPPPPPPPPPPALPVDPVVIVFPVAASSSINDMELSAYLSTNNVVIDNLATTGAGMGSITFTGGATVSWSAATTLTVRSFQSIDLDAGSSITNTGTGAFTSVDMEANIGETGAGAFSGIDIATGASISTTEGNIRLIGVSGTGIGDAGIEIDGSITATTGDIFLEGTSNSGIDGGFALNVSDAAAVISATTGNITLRGIGSGGTMPPPASGLGVLINFGTISTTTGDILIEGSTATNDFSAATGFGLGATPPTITTVSGTIDVRGTASGTMQGIGIFAPCVDFFSTGVGSTNPITFTAVGSGTGVSASPHFTSEGINITDLGFGPFPPTMISTMGAPVILTGTSGAVTPMGGSLNGGIRTRDGFTITANGTDAPITLNGIQGDTAAATRGLVLEDSIFTAGTGALTFAADRISLTAPLTISGTGPCVFDVITLAQSMTIGDDSPPITDFVFTNADTGFLTDGFSEIVFGNAAGVNTLTVEGMDLLTFTDPVRFRAQNVDYNDILMGGANDVTFQIGTGGPGILNLNNLVMTTGTVRGEGGAFEDRFNININCAPIIITGGGGACDLVVGPPGDNVWSITSDNAGSFVTSMGDTITFSGIESVQGGTDNDTFQFFGTASLDCMVDGGSSVPPFNNLLDYTNFTSPAIVTFLTATSGTASNLGAGFINIAGVIGNTISLGNATQPFFVQLSLAQRFLTDISLFHDFDKIFLSVIDKFALYGFYWGNINDTDVEMADGTFTFESTPYYKQRDVIDFNSGESVWGR